MAETIEKATNGGNQSVARNNSTRSRGGRRYSNNFLNEFEGDFVVMEVVFGNTDVLNRGFRGHFDGFSSGIFFLRRHLLISNDTALKDKLMSELDKLLQDRHQELIKKRDVAKKLIADNNLVIRTSNRGDKREVRVIDPFANRFLQLIKLADEVGRLFNQLWVAMIIKDNDKSNAINELIAHISGVHTFIRQAGNKARRLVDQRNAPKSTDAAQVSTAGSNYGNETTDKAGVQTEAVVKDGADNEGELLVDGPDDELVGDDPDDLDDLDDLGGDDDLGDGVKKGAAA